MAVATPTPRTICARGGYSISPVSAAGQPSMVMPQPAVVLGHRRCVSSPIVDGFHPSWRLAINSQASPRPGLGGFARSMTPQPKRPGEFAAPVFNSTLPLNEQVRLASRTKAAMRDAGMKVPTDKLDVVLPRESDGWSTLEVNLFLMSSGAYNPAVMARRRRVQVGSTPGTGVELEVVGRVSIVAPSMACRQHYHDSLWRCFEAQTWEDKELVVVETYEDTPSQFLQEKAKVDRRLVHVCIQRTKGTDFTVGLKRNMTLHMASGEFVVNFDDDDLYAACYVDRIVGEMRAKHLQAVTLSSWYNYYTGQGVCTYSDPGGWGEWANDAKELEEILYGYGFSYSHRRRPSLQHPYPNVGFAEDAPFLLKLKSLYGSSKVVLWKDEEGICMHIMHRANTAQVLGTSNVSKEEVARLKVADLKPFQIMIDTDFFQYSPWRPPVRPPAMSEDNFAVIQRKRATSTLSNTEDDDSPRLPRLRSHSFRNV